MTGAAVPLRIPQAGTAVTEGTLAEWLVGEGERVVEGQPVYRLETDKVEIDVESPASGILRTVGVAGETYPVGHEVGHVDPA